MKGRGTTMQWGLRVLLGVVAIGLLGIAVLALVIIVRPVVSEALRARSAGNAWLPFLPDAAGRYGPLANNHWWSAMRAETEGSTTGLGIRWGFWVLMSGLIVFAMGSMVTSGVRLVLRGWS
ncbi:MAG: hypothetical protein ABIQ61_01415 [Ornithinibacter sp.]